MKVLSELDVANKRVFLRADLDVPVGTLMVNGKSIIDDAEQATRLTNLKPTVDYLLEHEAKQVFIAGHIDRPVKPDPALSTKQLLPALEKILERKIGFVPDVLSHSHGNENQDSRPSVLSSGLRLRGRSDSRRSKDVRENDKGGDSIASLQNDRGGGQNDGRLVLLENLRFWPGEVANSQDFAQNLANLADVYVNEAFGNSHRNHASMVALPALLPHAAGLHLQLEVETLNKLLKQPQRPFIAVVGGAKVETKVPVIENLAKIADLVLVGGELPLEIQKTGRKCGQNVVVGTLTEDTNELSPGSTDEFIDKIKKAKIIVWNGPVGFFEKGYEKATLAIAEAISKSGAHSVVGGGDTTQFLVSRGLLNKFSFVSAGGGAMLEFLAGKELPALKALE